MAPILRRTTEHKEAPLSTAIDLADIGRASNSKLQSAKELRLGEAGRTGGLSSDAGAGDAADYGVKALHSRKPQYARAGRGHEASARDAALCGRPWLFRRLISRALVTADIMPSVWARFPGFVDDMRAVFSAFAKSVTMPAILAGMAR
jgi:hypothetical protein